MRGWKRLNLRRLIARALAFEASAGALHGCPCPPESAPELAEAARRIDGGATKAFRAYHVDLCVHACAGFGMTCDVARAAAADKLAPLSQATCMSVSDAGPGVPTQVYVAVPPWTGRENMGDPVRAPTCQDLCGTPYCSLEGATFAHHTVLCRSTPPVPIKRCSAGGRAPAGLRPVPSDGLGTVDPVADYWRSMAHLERASVGAFVELAHDLERHGAPPDLVRRARAAARDEARHANLCEARLVARGVPLALLERDVQPAMDLWRLAVQNAREGCVREAFGALVARVQAARVTDEDTRRTFDAIADDETAHGQLAWDIHAWLRATLSSDEGEALDRELVEALTALGVEALEAADAPGLAEVGYPDGMALRALTAAFVGRVRAHVAVRTTPC